MALTRVSAGNKVIQWDDKFFSEYVRANLFNPYMGVDENAIIQIKENLVKKKGDSITISLLSSLRGKGVRGNARLQGSEEQLGNYDHNIPVYPLRNGVAVTEWDEQMTVIDLRNGGRVALKNWAMETLRDDTVTALMSMGGKAYLASQVLADSSYSAIADETVKDAFLVQNADRFLFGAAKSNNAANDHSASLANIDNTADKLSAGIVSLSKRMAKQASPSIRPVMTKQGEEWFVMFANSEAFRDLKNDTTILAANREAWQRYNGGGKLGSGTGSNPIFRDGDLIYDGVIIREISDIPTLEGVGAGSIDVAPCFLCGAQAMGLVWAQRIKSRTNTEDYGFENGVAVSEMRGLEKLLYDNDDLGKTDVQHGVVTVYVAGVADA